MNIKYLFFLIFTTISFSQQKGIVYYGQIESIRLGPKNGPEAFSYLIFNKSEAYYVTKKDSLQNLNPIALKEMYQNTDGSFVNINPNIYTTKRGFEVYTNLSKDSIWSSYKWKDFAFLKEKKLDLKWKLSNDTKKIGKFVCLKATCKLRGRDYIAWYTPDIPIPFGPWKLQGLPGLILEAYTTDEEIYFSAKKIEYPTKNPIIISKIEIDKGKKWLTFNEYLNWNEKNLDYTFQKGLLLGIKESIRSNQKDVFKEYME